MGIRKGQRGGIPRGGSRDGADALRLAAGVVLVCISSTLRAQEVRGVAHVNGTDAPSVETTILLVDMAEGTAVAGVITRADGSYMVHAPRAGLYRIRARRIGFTPDSSAILRLGAATVATFNPVLRRAAVAQLERVRVETERRCKTTREAGAAAIRLWEDAQSALSATLVTAPGDEGDRLGFVLQRFQREVDPVTSRVWRSRTMEMRAAGPEPFVSISADSLAAHGFVTPHADSTHYAVPDARTLTSDAFARTHCFHGVGSDTLHSGLAGLAFEPVNPNRGRDVAGVLWIDTASSQLRFIEYHYTGESNLASLGLGPPGGRVDFERLATGAWVVNHWTLRVPVVGVVFRADSLPAAQTGQPTTAMRPHFLTLYETGGDVVSTFHVVGDTSSAVTTLGGLDGMVVDSADDNNTHHGMRDVQLSLARVPTAANVFPIRTASTDTSGTFRFDSLAAGNYTLSLSSARLDTLRVEVASRTIHIESGVRQWVATVLPPVSTSVAALCTGTRAGNGSVLHGIVSDAVSREPLRHAFVTVSWRDSAASGAAGSGSAAQRWTAVTDTLGGYVICGVPHSGAITVSATLGTVHTPMFVLQPILNAVRMYDIAIAGGLASGGLVVTVRNTAGDALGRAEVHVDSASWRHVTDAGTFSFSHIATGRHLLEARAVGFGLHSWYITIRGGAPVSATLALSSAARLPTVRIMGRIETLQPDGSSLSGFLHRRAVGTGRYLDEHEIAARGFPPLTELMRRMPGVRLLPVQGSSGETNYEIQMRGKSTLGVPGTGPVSARCPVQVYIDGVAAYVPDLGSTPGALDHLLGTTEIAGMEVYPGGSSVPAQFSGPNASCGVIVVWTKSTVADSQ